MRVTPHQQVSLGETESVCPVCLQRLAARRVGEGNDVYLVKECPAHGAFKTVIWRGLDSWHAWGARGSRAARPPVCETGANRGCPFDCGLCPEHRQHSCCVLLEVTPRCNLKCPVCFASSATAGDDPTTEKITDWLNLLKAHGSPVNIQLSGGEPTVRDDLPELVARCRAQGFPFVQLNTNGVRLAKETGYASRLASAGLDCVFLQFDAAGEGADTIYQRIRGARLHDLKIQAIERCAEAGLGVVLVPTLVPGVNIDRIGAIIAFALARVPTIRAVHFQPISYFGRYPAAPWDAARITLPEIMTGLEAQSRGRIRATDFSPGSAENAYCSFFGKFFVGRDGKLQAAREPLASGCCSGPPKGKTSSACGCGVPAPEQDSARSRRFVASNWVAPTAPASVHGDVAGVDVSSFDAFLANHQHSFCISGMAFQDAWTLDLERLRECFIHVVSPDRRVVPFCAYNLSAMSGESLYRQSVCANA